MNEKGTAAPRLLVGLAILLVLAVIVGLVLPGVVVTDGLAELPKETRPGNRKPLKSSTLRVKRVS